MSAEVTIAGEDDANWVDGEVELQTGLTGRFSARHPVSIRTDEIARFRDELTSLMEALSGEATLEHLEGEFGAKVTLHAGAGDLDAFVAENTGARLRVEHARIDQSYLTETLRELNAAVEAFPVRGSAYD